ncbi:ThiF family adenylyltransferase [Ferviditalea candida]|uniref:ThiF family adenylyltransferase n=1 Tax=Ferviditalea candida TaxID=3108399 RepID=A0ABU5ZJV8_9BACL|nr:ThiF family adenylyltransferase [Paenibacillaceae bacterium T2]
MDEHIESRYSRQLLFTPIGREGQAKLLRSKVAVIGMGALGTVISSQLVRGGVGHVKLIDRDFIEFSNLQRQMLYDEEDAASHLPKAEAARLKLTKINSEVTVESFVADLNVSNTQELLDGVDLIMDGSDNMAVRFLINDIAFQKGIPYIYGGAVSSRGMVAAFIPGKTACFQCLFGGSAESGRLETCDTVGVIAPIVDIVSSRQVTLALKILTGHADLVKPVLKTFDIWHDYDYEMSIEEPRQNCPTCQLKQYPYAASREKEDIVETLCGRDSVQIRPRVKRALDMDDLLNRLKPLGRVEQNGFLIRFFTGDYQMTIFPDSRVMIHGTHDKKVAKSLYARYIGS